MIAPPQPANEQQRLDALRDYDLLDTIPEQELDDLTALAAQICNAPIALITLVDDRRQWFKSRIGLSATETTRDVSFCAHAILQPELFIVPDATLDERFADNPMVTGEPHIRFYAGAPLITGNDHAIGTICVIDRVPRQLSPLQKESLRILSRQVVTQMELRRQARNVVESEARLFKVFENCPVGLTVHRMGDRCFVDVNAAFSALTGWTRNEVVGHTSDEMGIVSADVAAELSSRLKEGQAIRDLEVILRTRDGGVIQVIIGTVLVELRGEIHAVTTFVDITDRKRALEEADTQARRLAMATEAVSVGIWDWNPKTDEWFASSTYYTMLGYDPVEGLSDRKVWLGRLHPQDQALVRKKIEDLLAGSTEPYEYEARMLHADGSYRWIHVIGRVLEVDEHGNVSRVTGVRMDITDRKLSEQVTLLAERRYRTLFEYAPEGIVIADGESTYLDANPSICRMLGYTRDELVGLNASDIVVRSEIPHITPALTQITTSDSYNREWQFLRKDGSVFQADVSATMMPDGKLLGMIRDITWRKEAEQRIEYLNRVYAVLTAINQSILRNKDSQSVLMDACKIAVENGRFSMAWIGLTDKISGRLEIVGHAGATDDTLAILRALIGDGQSEMNCAFTLSAMTTGQHSACNDISNDPKAELWRNEALARGYRSMASLPLIIGEIVIGTVNLYAQEKGFFDVNEMRLLDDLATDIAFALEMHERDLERVRIQEALHESEERFQQLADNIQEVFWVADPNVARMLYVSTAYEKIWGRTSASLYESPHTWIESIHPDDRARIVQAVETKQKRGDYDETYRIQHPDGSVRWIRDRAFPVRDATGNVFRVVGTAVDITKGRELEDQLRQSQKMEAIGQLAGGVAHDFNNILGAIMMQADLASTVADCPSETRELLEDIKAATERAANLTRQLLAFGRRQVMQPRVLDLNEIVTSMTKMLKRIVGEDVSLQLNLHPLALWTRADAGMLDQVLLNLVVNARDAMPGGGQLVIETTEKLITKIEASSIPDGVPGNFVSVRVADRGSGIAPEHLPHVFEPFFTTKEQGKGTGLGLATVFGIVKQHGGAIRVESAVGVGTTVEIFLPAIEPESRPQNDVAKNNKARGGNETILLVEDEPAVRTVARIILERMGYHIFEAPDGVQALRVWEEHGESIQLLLTDIVMPEGLSGRELAIRLQSRNPLLRVIFTSGYSPDIAGRKLSLKDGQDFIQKPYSPQQLLDIVRRRLDE